MSPRIGCAAAALTATLSWQVAAQTFQDGRAPLIDGQVQELRLEVSSLDGSPGNRTAVVPGLPTARIIKLRLEHVRGSNVPPGIVVVVWDANNNEVVRYSGEKLAEERLVWTPLVRGATARVEVTGQAQAGAEFRVLITAVALMFFPQSRRSILSGTSIWKTSSTSG